MVAKTPDTTQHKCRFTYAVCARCSCGWTSSTWYGKGAQGSAAGEFRLHKQACDTKELCHGNAD